MAPVAGIVSQSSRPVGRTRISPSNRLGSGSDSVASVPVISTKPCRRSGESKLSTSVAAGPRAYPISAATWVGTSTSNLVPARGPLPMTRLGWPRRPSAATWSAGPNRVASMLR